MSAGIALVIASLVAAALMAAFVSAVEMLSVFRRGPFAEVREGQKLAVPGAKKPQTAVTQWRRVILIDAGVGAALQGVLLLGIAGFGAIGLSDDLAANVLIQGLAVGLVGPAAIRAPLKSDPKDPDVKVPGLLGPFARIYDKLRSGSIEEARAASSEIDRLLRARVVEAARGSGWDAASVLAEVEYQATSKDPGKPISGPDKELRDQIVEAAAASFPKEVAMFDTALIVVQRKGTKALFTKIEELGFDGTSPAITSLLKQCQIELTKTGEIYYERREQEIADRFAIEMARHAAASS